jgi:hypothetical protein
MVKLLTRPTEPDLTAVEGDPAVVAAREDLDEIAERNRTLRREQQEIDFLSNPNSASTDHRRLLSEAELITLHDRRVEVLRALRQIPGAQEAATAALGEARRRAVDARRAACRARVTEKLQRFYQELNRISEGPHAALVAEVEAMSAILHVPGTTAPFAHLVSPEFLPGGIHADRRRQLERDGWLPS